MLISRQRKREKLLKRLKNKKTKRNLSKPWERRTKISKKPWRKRMGCHHLRKKSTRRNILTSINRFIRLRRQLRELVRSWLRAVSTTKRQLQSSAQRMRASMSALASAWGTSTCTSISSKSMTACTKLSTVTIRQTSTQRSLSTSEGTSTTAKRIMLTTLTPTMPILARNTKSMPTKEATLTKLGTKLKRSSKLLPRLKNKVKRSRQSLSQRMRRRQPNPSLLKSPMIRKRGIRMLRRRMRNLKRNKVKTRRLRVKTKSKRKRIKSLKKTIKSLKRTPKSLRKVNPPPLSKHSPSPVNRGQPWWSTSHLSQFPRRRRQRPSELRKSKTQAFLKTILKTSMRSTPVIRRPRNWPTNFKITPQRRQKASNLLSKRSTTPWETPTRRTPWEPQRTTT